MIVLVTGGTGGHVFPAIALRDILLKHNKKVHIIIDQRGIKFLQKDESTLVIPINRTSKFLGKLIYPFSLVNAFLKNLMFFMKKRPTLVMGFGGYTTLPSILAAFILRIPIVIQEGNSFLGKGNRFLQKFATYICTSFPNTTTAYPEKTHCFGLPLRQTFFEERINYPPPALDEQFHILIIGGSQGAKLFSDIIPKAVALLDFARQKKIVIHQQARPEYVDETISIYKHTQATVVVKSFFEDMPFEYAWAHLVIARAGASTLFELAHTKRPAIVIPFYSSIEGDQQKNADSFSSQNACWLFSEKQVTAKNIADHISELMEDPRKLVEKSEAIEKLSNTNIEKDFLHLLFKK
jgi:UDP-N-acetylglucosamine--N-acetylmuramyl-(pentapeptide) pyrophosphoryl-undecaprenol N-acetylglucosamine transferase